MKKKASRRKHKNRRSENDSQEKWFALLLALIYFATALIGHV
jgi:hypothetical protein